MCVCEQRTSNEAPVKLTAIGSWDELLDSPRSVGVVRASGNWICRLTTTVVALQKSHQVYVLEGTACILCTCWRDLIATPERKQQNLILIY